ncbi:hypothetical protein SO802_005468 [Lithocarpus litseifolius]|uniref:Uncharacterized protein n=1 Tax=Lithocarpus litseifolius TaxID=425828 RepID=A0AAW2DMG9_9ROSI
MERVLHTGPWTFDKNLLALHKLGEDEQIQNIGFQKISFGVQIHDLPARRMTKETGERIGRTIGEVGEVDFSTKDNLLGRKEGRFLDGDTPETGSLTLMQVTPTTAEGSGRTEYTDSELAPKNLGFSGQLVGDCNFEARLKEIDDA